MARIRTIKPEFFKHEDMFDAEKETGLPLRLAFAGLWTVCDREGRFEWRPRAIKTDVLPYDDVDFSRVLDALATRGFVVRYRVDGKDYGFVPGFSRHQVINGRESESKIPEPDQYADIVEYSTRERRVNDASPTRHDLARGEREGKGKGKGREGEDGSYDPLSSGDDDCLPDDPPSDEIQQAVDAYNDAAQQAGWPQVQKLTPARRSAIKARLKDAGGIDGWMFALGKARASPHLCGQNDRGWTASFDFLTRQSSFAKLMEGNYDRSTARNSRQTAADEALRRRLDAAARID